MKFNTQFIFNHIPNVIILIQHFIISNKNDMFLLPFSKCLIYPFICGKIIHNGLTISPFLWPIKYLKPSSLCLNLSDTNILSILTKLKSIGCLDLWNSFLLSIILLNFSVFSVIFYTKKKTKNNLFFNDFFILNQFLITLFLVLFNLAFFFLW